MGQEHGHDLHFNDTSFVTVIQRTCEQMFGDEALKEQIERMKKATFLNADPEEAIEKLQEITNNLEFFESGALKMLERELIKDVNGKNL